MKALTFDGVGKIKVVDKPVPELNAAHEAIVRMIRTTICGTDLHIIKGDVPTVEKGRTLGHEGIGIIEQTGSSVINFKPGDKVLIACITGCSTCTFCKRSMQDQCKNGGWTLGHTADGTQAEYLRIVYADTNLYHVPPDTSERDLLVFSDILPTGLEVGVLKAGKNVRPGSSVAIVGAGPVGLACGLAARLYAPGKVVFFDVDPGRLDVARKMGATGTVLVGKGEEGQVREMSREHFGEIDGFDTVIEAVGYPETFQMCQDLVGIGGHIANVGVHGTKCQLDIDRLWPRSTSISMALVSSHTIPTLLDLAAAGKLNEAGGMVTHDFTFDQIEEAYNVFGKAAEHKALKMNIEFK